MGGNTRPLVGVAISASLLSLAVNSVSGSLLMFLNFLNFNFTI
jgi:hypothetical protein